MLYINCKYLPLRGGVRKADGRVSIPSHLKAGDRIGLPLHSQLKKEVSPMSQKNLSTWLKAVIIGTGIFGLIVFGGLIPAYGTSFASMNPEIAYCYWPWQIFLWLCSVPCFVSLFFGWKIASNIGNDNSFSFDNAKNLKIISALAAGDSAFFFIGNWALVFMDMSHPGVAIILAPLVIFVGIAISIVCAALSHLVYKSAVLQNENDLTI